MKKERGYEFNGFKLGQEVMFNNDIYEVIAISDHCVAIGECNEGYLNDIANSSLARCYIDEDWALKTTYKWVAQEAVMIVLEEMTSSIPDEEEVKEAISIFHSSHYESESIEPIEFMMSNKLDFCRGSIIKYTFRAGKKQGQEVLDIKKIIDYALLLAMQEGVPIDKEQIIQLINYRFDWQSKRQK